MIFNSLEFLIFYPLVVLLYFIVKPKYRWTLLLVASYYFYMVWKPVYLILLIASTVVNYFISLKLDDIVKEKKRKVLLYISLAFNLGMLFVFKYFNFMIDSINNVMGTEFNYLNLLLPMGISFYTFQALSYTVDVYKKRYLAEKHLGIFALYISFFPQLVAGPIERADRLIPQFHEKKEFNYENCTYGLKRMAIGFFKKVVIADRIAVIVNAIYNNPHEYSGGYFIVATICFGIQIYCDFSGYSDIAIGAAKVMGFDLMENFKRPYFSKSISEFWGRWHISLSSWFRDYLYIPLGGNRVKVSRHYFNLFVTFLVSGLWHGASWTFVIWGALHGFYLVMEKVLEPLRANILNKVVFLKKEKILDIINIIITNSLVMFAWIFFRANNISDAIYIIKNIGNGILEILNPINVFKVINVGGLPKTDLGILILSIIILFIISLIERKLSLIEYISNKPKIIRNFIYYGILMYLLVGSYVGNSEFIYFQF